MGAPEIAWLCPAFRPNRGDIPAVFVSADGFPTHRASADRRRGSISPESRTQRASPLQVGFCPTVREPPAAGRSGGGHHTVAYFSNSSSVTV
jgi:hypothetical protein